MDEGSGSVTGNKRKRFFSYNPFISVAVSTTTSPVAIAKCVPKQLGCIISMQRHSKSTGNGKLGIITTTTTDSGTCHITCHVTVEGGRVGKGKGVLLAWPLFSLRGISLLHGLPVFLLQQV